MIRSDILSYIYTHTNFELPPEPILSTILDESYADITIELLVTQPLWENRLRKYWQNQQWVNYYSVNNLPFEILPLMLNYIRITDLTNNTPIYFLTDHTQFMTYFNNTLTYAIVEDNKLRFNKPTGLFNAVYMRVMDDDDVDLSNINVVVNNVLRRVMMMQQAQQQPVIIQQPQQSEQGNG